MRLTVNHTTLYRYDQPVRSLVQSHRLTPSVFLGHKTLDWKVSVSGGTKGASFRDGAGDFIQAWSVAGPIDEVVVTVEGTVETQDTSGVLRGHKELAPPEAYLRDTYATETSKALIDLAHSVTEDSPLGLAHGLSAAVAEAIAYRPGSTNAHTSAAEALALGEGVCQDHAHALIALARVRGLAGRYVSGYLFADAQGSPHEAAHAWAEVFIPNLGWVGFDPANQCCPDERYIRLGSGFDARDAAPIRGVARGMSADAGREALEVSVAVRAADQ